MKINKAVKIIKLIHFPPSPKVTITHIHTHTQKAKIQVNIYTSNLAKIENSLRAFCQILIRR